jgi:hypothetical protein
MGQPSRYHARKLVEYDALRRRLWILGQRCHHGATGTVVAGLACIGLIAVDRDPRSPFVAAIATGGALMAHDWKDHSMWFQRGRGAQP